MNITSVWQPITSLPTPKGDKASYFQQYGTEKVPSVIVLKLSDRLSRLEWEWLDHPYQDDEAFGEWVSDTDGQYWSAWQLAQRFDYWCLFPLQADTEAK